MATDPVLRMLGLARRAGKLAYGDELVREAHAGVRVYLVPSTLDTGLAGEIEPHFTPIRPMCRA